MRIEANYVSIVFTLVIAMLLTTYFAHSINNSVENIIKSTRGRDSRLINCIYSIQFNYTKIVILDRVCIGEILYIVLDNGTIHYGDEYIWIKASLRQDIKIITREEIIIV